MGSGRLPAVPGHLFSGVSPVLQEVRSYLTGIGRASPVSKERVQGLDSKKLYDSDQGHREQDPKGLHPMPGGI